MMVIEEALESVFEHPAWVLTGNPSLFLYLLHLFSGVRSIGYDVSLTHDVCHQG
jgi:hypothetical protein